MQHFFPPAGFSYYWVIFLKYKSDHITLLLIFFRIWKDPVCFFFFLGRFYLFILFLAVLGLCCCLSFSLVGTCELLIEVASFVAGFSGGTTVKNPPANSGGWGSIRGSGRSPGEGNGNPLQYSCLENPMNRGDSWAIVLGVTRSWTGLAPHSSTLAWKIPWMEEPGRLQSIGSLRVGDDWAERLHFYFSLSFIGEGNGNPLQCSCLENPRGRGAWLAAIYGVAQSWTWLKWLSSSSSD